MTFRASLPNVLASCPTPLIQLRICIAQFHFRRLMKNRAWGYRTARTYTGEGAGPSNIGHKPLELKRPTKEPQVSELKLLAQGPSSIREHQRSGIRREGSTPGGLLPAR